MSQSTQKFDIDNQQLSLAGGNLSISKGNTVTLPLEIPIGGTSGQLLAKQSDTNYDVTWVDEAPSSSYTSVVKHKVKAGESLTKGQAVYVSSASGTNIIVTKASNTSEATSSKTMGLIAQTLANNGQGDVVTEGLLSGLNTNTATIGDPVWLGTNGNLIYGLVNKPYAPAHLVFIGIVTRVSATVGEIFVKIQNGFELTEIHDVDLKTTAPVNGDILGYNGTLWVNKSITGLGGQTQLNGTGFVKATGTTISYDNSTYLSTSSAASTYLPINNPTSTGTLTAPTITNSLGANFATTSGKVGIGTTTPSQTLTVSNISGSAIPSSGTAGGHLYLTNGDYGGMYGVNYSGNTWIQSGRSDGLSTNYNILLNPNGGNVGIGTTAPSSKLTVAGTDGTSTISLTETGVRNYVIRSGGYGTNVFDIADLTAGASRFVINSTGNVGINTGADLGYKLDVNGTTRLNGNVSIGTVSNSRTLTVATTTNAVNIESANNTTTGTNYSISAYSFGVGATLNVGALLQAADATSNYGLRIFNVAASANNYAIYSDSSAQSYFQGSVGIGTTAATSKLQVVGLLEYATNALAITGGLTVGAFYHTAGVVKVVI